MSWGDRLGDALAWACGLLAAALIVLCLLLLVGVIPTGPDDPCVLQRAKLSDIHYTGWHEYGGRHVWCGPGRTPKP